MQQAVRLFWGSWAMRLQQRVSFVGRRPTSMSLTFIRSLHVSTTQLLASCNRKLRSHNTENAVWFLVQDVRRKSYFAIDFYTFKMLSLLSSKADIAYFTFHSIASPWWRIYVIASQLSHLIRTVTSHFFIKVVMYVCIITSVPALRSRLQNGVRGVSYFQLVSGSLDMKNHRGACLPSWAIWRYGQI